MLISIGFCFRTIALLWLLAHFVALSAPVSLRPGTITTPMFRTDVNYWDYQLDIQFEPKFERLPVMQNLLAAKTNPFPVRVNDRLFAGIECLLGAEVRPEQCSAIKSLIDISWELREGQNTVAEGSSHRFDGGLELANDKVARTVGMFRAQRWHHYTVVLHINSDASELDLTQPRVFVHIPYGYGADVGMGYGFAGLFAIVSGLIGLVLVRPAARRWAAQRRSRR
ncbi:MAG TPA: hypothetical protein VGR72_14860 [Candidatus Acidoferrales bacterium]|nr:hypothetical protein [Candidatus Acidoferrales bacterium]